MNSKDEKEILEQFIHENPELEKLEEIVEEFNIFTALSIVNNEIRHSNFLSWLMNPGESHGLGDYFLSSFLKKISFKASSLGIEGPSVFDIDSWSFDDVEILREWRNIDLLIRSDNRKFICIVENKITSREHSNQLIRYKDIVDKEFSAFQKLFVYLTVEGDIPSESEYIPLSYSCRFWLKAATHSGINLPLIPGETCHPFRKKVYHFLYHFRNPKKVS